MQLTASQTIIKFTHMYDQMLNKPLGMQGSIFDACPKPG